MRTGTAPRPDAVKTPPAKVPFVARRPVVVVLAALALAVVGVLLAGPAYERLAAGGFDDPGSESTRAAQQIEDRLGARAPDVLALYSSSEHQVTDPRGEEALHQVVTDLRARPEVMAVQSQLDPGASGFVSADRRHTYLAIQLRADDDTARRQAYERIEPLLEADGLHVEVAGDIVLQDEGDGITAADVERAEIFSFPVLLILLILIFRGLVAAVLPLLVGGLAILGGLAAIRALESVMTVSTFALNSITLLGLGMAVDYSLILVSRYREQLRAGARPAEAVTVTLATAGRTVLISGLTVSLALASLLVFPAAFLKSMAYGGIAAVAIAMLRAVTVLPALLILLGHRIDSLRLDRTDRRTGTGAGGWARFARLVMRRPLAATVGVGAVLLALASPLAHLHLGGFDQRVLPPDATSRIATDDLAEQFPALTTAPMQVLVTSDTADTAQAPTTIADRIRTLDGVTDVRPTAHRGKDTLLLVGYQGTSGSSRTRDLVDRIRAVSAPDAHVMVAGPSAEVTDQIASLEDRLPLMFAVMGAVILVLLFLAFGSIVLPIKAVVLNLLSVAATTGVLVWAFQDGHLASLLGFTPTHDIEPNTLVLVIALIFGLSTDYEVFLLARVREEWDHRGNNEAAVAHGLQRTGGLITAAALLLGVVTIGFATGDIVISQIVGTGMLIGLAIDAILVRIILVPATMRLLGRLNWWLPRPLSAVHRRIGLRDAG